MEYCLGMVRQQLTFYECVSVRGMKTVAIIVFLLACANSSVSDSTDDPSGWSTFSETESHRYIDDVDVVDPTGWNYDRATKRSIGTVKEDKMKQVEMFCKRVIEKKDFRTNLMIENEIEVAIKSKIEMSFNEQSTAKESVTFVKRFVSILLNAAALPKSYTEEGPDISGIVEIKVSAEHLKKLMDFSNSVVNISMRELDSILSASIHKKYVPKLDVLDVIQKIYFMVSLKEVWLPVVLIAVMVCVFRLLVTSKTVTRFATSLLILIFVVSYFVEYYRMYKEVEIRQKVILDQHPEIPSSCNPTNQAWYSAFLSSFSFKKDNECEKYHKALLLDPLVEVSPSHVLTNILVDIILHPADKIGTAIAVFSSAIFDGLPIQFGWIVWICSCSAVFLLICLALVMLIGGSIQWRGFFSGVSVSSAQAPQIPSPPAAPALPASAPSRSVSQPHLEAVAGMSNFVLMDANSLGTLVLRAQSSVALSHSGVQDLTRPAVNPLPCKCKEKIDLSEIQKKRALAKPETNKSIGSNDCESCDLKQEFKKDNIASEEEEKDKEVDVSDIKNVKEELLGTFEVIQSEITCEPSDGASFTKCENVK